MIKKEQEKKDKRQQNDKAAFSVDGRLVTITEFLAKKRNERKFFHFIRCTTNKWTTQMGEIIFKRKPFFNWTMKEEANWQWTDNELGKKSDEIVDIHRSIKRKSNFNSPKTFLSIHFNLIDRI